MAVSASLVPADDQADSNRVPVRRKDTVAASARWKEKMAADAKSRRKNHRDDSATRLVSW